MLAAWYYFLTLALIFILFQAPSPLAATCRKRLPWKERLDIFLLRTYQADLERSPFFDGYKARRCEALT